jgi:hypothetical protein
MSVFLNCGVGGSELILFPSVEHKISIISVYHNINLIVIIGKKTILAVANESSKYLVDTSKF